LTLIDEILSEEELDDLSLYAVEEDVEEEEMLTEEALALIDEILEDDEFDDVMTFKPTQINREVAFALLPTHTEEPADRDFIWDEIDIDENGDLTEDEQSFLHELGF
jgi:hypothetical protein